MILKQHYEFSILCRQTEFSWWQAGGLHDHFHSRQMILLFQNLIEDEDDGLVCILIDTDWELQGVH